MTKKRAILVEGLKKNVMRVTFTKVNGEETLSVWDLDNDGWRSFRLDSIKEMKVIEGVEELL